MRKQIHSTGTAVWNPIDTRGQCVAILQYYSGVLTNTITSSGHVQPEEPSYTLTDPRLQEIWMIDEGCFTVRRPLYHHILSYIVYSVTKPAVMAVVSVMWKIFQYIGFTYTEPDHTMKSYHVYHNMFAQLSVSIYSPWEQKCNCNFVFNILRYKFDDKAGSRIHHVALNCMITRII